MRVVLDTNVLVSAVVFGGPPGEIAALGAARQLQLVLSPPLVAELRRVLREKFEFSDDALYLTETLLRRASTLVQPNRTLAVIAEDPDDNRVLEAAIEANADVIVSGDHHPLTLRSFQNIPVITPRQLLDRLRRGRRPRTRRE